MTDTLRVVIVDDEPLARAVIREYLRAHPGVEVVAECGNGFDAVKAVTELSPDLVFLDVQMPKLSGFEVVELLGRDVPVVFTTAHDQYALRAFEVHAVDYLRKPFNEERFAEALSRARARLLTREAVADVEALVSDVRSKQGPVERVLIRDGSQVHVLPIGTIDYVEAQDDYVCFKANGKQDPEGADDGGAGGDDGSGALRSHPPVVPLEHRAHRPRRALRQGQPGGHPARWDAPAGEPRRLCPAIEAAVGFFA